MQWSSFPSGHDDMMDATYWMAFAAFGSEAPMMGSKLPPVGLASIPEVAEEVKCERVAHLAYGQPLRTCLRCMRELEDRLGYDDKRVEVQPTIGAPVYGRHRIGLGLRRR